MGQFSSTKTWAALPPNSVVAKALSDRLLHVALEEVAHYVTGATDNSRDFQNFLLDLAVKLRRGRVAEAVAG